MVVFLSLQILRRKFLMATRAVSEDALQTDGAFPVTLTADGWEHKVNWSNPLSISPQLLVQSPEQPHRPRSSSSALPFKYSTHWKPVLPMCREHAVFSVCQDIQILDLWIYKRVKPRAFLFAFYFSFWHFYQKKNKEKWAFFKRLASGIQFPAGFRLTETACELVSSSQLLQKVQIQWNLTPLKFLNWNKKNQCHYVFFLCIANSM